MLGPCKALISVLSNASDAVNALDFQGTLPSYTVLNTRLSSDDRDYVMYMCIGYLLHGGSLLRTPPHTLDAARRAAAPRVTGRLAAGRAQQGWLFQGQLRTDGVSAEWIFYKASMGGHLHPNACYLTAVMFEQVLSRANMPLALPSHAGRGPTADALTAADA